MKKTTLLILSCAMLAGCAPKTIVTPKQGHYSTYVKAYTIEAATQSTNKAACKTCKEESPVFISDFITDSTRLGFWKRLDSGHSNVYEVTAKFKCE